MSRTRTAVTPKPKAKVPRQTVGVRLSADDKTFLAQVAPDDSPSDALRKLIEQARELRTPPPNFDEAMRRVHGLIPPMTLDKGARSRVVEDLLREAEQLLALALTQGRVQAVDARLQFEAELVDRGFDLVDTLMQAAVLDEAPAWDPAVVQQRLVRSRPLVVAAIAAVARTHPPRAPQE